MEHTSEPIFVVVLLVSLPEIFSGIEISLASSNGLTRPAGPDLVKSARFVVNYSKFIRGRRLRGTLGLDISMTRGRIDLLF